MWHRVARWLGCTVREAQARVTSAEFTEMMAYYQLEPWGHESDWLRTGQVCAVTASVWQGKRGKRLTASDFIPKFGPKLYPGGKELMRKFEAFKDHLRRAGNGRRHQ